MPGMDTSVILSIEDAGRWFEHRIHRCGGPCCFEAVRDKFRGGISMSTAFSGIDSPGNAANCLECAFKILNSSLKWALDTVVHFVHSSAVEYDSEAQRELIVSPFRPDCLFENHNSFWNPAIHRMQ